MTNRQVTAAALEAYERSCNSDPAGAYSHDAELFDQINLERSRQGKPPLTLPSEVSANVNERKHSHYFKDVAHLSVIDIYRVCQLFGVDDPSGATQHALKKILLPGQRGAGKDRSKDLQEAVDTLNRKLEMMKEDAQ